MSRTVATNCGSRESFQVCWRCGCSPKARQIRATALCESPSSVASERVDQCVASFGVVSSVRTITHLCVNRAGDYIWIDVEADGFLYNMVRAIAGTLIYVGRGFWPETKVAEILELQDRTLAGPTAPAQGLFLVRVTYE